MKLEELEKIIQHCPVFPNDGGKLYITAAHMDFISACDNYMPKLIAVVKIAKEHVKDCGDGAWYDPALAEALKDLEGQD